MIGHAAPGFEMKKIPLRVLLVEDVDDDSVMVLRALRRGGYEPTSVRVETAAAMQAQLEAQIWDLIISDYSLPQFDALAALRLVQQCGLDLPFIIVSGTIGEDTAVAAMKAGAHDYLMKGKLTRLVATVERELREAKSRGERRRAEGALRTSEERFRTLVGSLPDMVFTLDREQRYDGIFGQSPVGNGVGPTVFLNKTARDILGPEAAGPHELANARALAGEQVVYEWSMTEADGSRHFQTSLSAMRDPKGQVTGLVGVRREITEQRLVQAQLLMSDRMVSVGTLAAGVAHEINNPLAAVLANLDFLSRSVSKVTSESSSEVALFTEEMREPLQDAREAAERVRQIVRDLKMFSRADDERSGPVDVQRAIESSLRMAWNEIRHRARLVKDYGVVPPVEGNDARLGQVFLNLIVNAAQAIPEGHSESNEIRVITRPVDDGRVLVEIRDTGEGISPEILPRIFDPFFTTKPVGIGTGLGLSICYRIMTAMKGELKVESEVGKGTIFRVFLPAASLEQKAPGAAVPNLPASRRGRILVVDDEPMVATAVRRTLRQHEVLAASNAEEALVRISGGEQFDVILCDLMMPQMTGMEFHAELSRVKPEQASRIIFLTGGAFTRGAREFLDRVPNQRIEKPFDTHHMIALINDRVH